MIHHSAVSLDYLENRLKAGETAYIQTWSKEKGWRTGYPITVQALQVAAWRSQEYAYAPPCDNVTPDGRCAGHEKKD